MEDKLLSVCLITYNHANYIEKAIESIIMQKVNFNWELIIADDFSTDGTREILKEYHTRYPNLIRLIFQEKNVGPAQNWLDLIRAPRGKYIAYCDGDDYWTDEKKMQLQVDFLESNPSFSACFHAFSVLENRSGKSSEANFKILKEKEVFETKDFIKNWFLQTSTIVFASKCTKNLPEFYTYYPNDVFLLMLLSLTGGVKFIDRNMSIYRNNYDGISKRYLTKNIEDKRILYRTKAYELFNEYTKGVYEKEIINNLERVKWEVKISRLKYDITRMIITLMNITKFNYFERYQLKYNISITAPSLYKLYLMFKGRK